MSKNENYGTVLVKQPISSIVNNEIEKINLKSLMKCI